MLLSPVQCGHYLRMCWGITAGLFLLFSFWVNLAGLPLRGFDPRGQQKQEDLKPWFQLTVTCYSMLTINTLPVSFFFIGITRDLLESFFHWFSFLGWRAFCPRIANAFKSEWYMNVLLHFLFNSIIVHFLQICCGFSIMEYLTNVILLFVRWSLKLKMSLKWMKLTISSNKKIMCFWIVCSLSAFSVF